MKHIKIRKLILHIGSHKTGTTYVQKYFKESNIIKNNKKLLYAKSGCNTLYGHHDIYSAIKTNSNKLESIFEFMAKEVTNFHDTIFLSSENFEYLNSQEIKKILSFFDCEQVMIFYLYRGWTPLLYAMWQEEVKHGEAVTFERYCLRHIGFPLSSKLLNYSLALDNYEKAVGRENIYVASYDILKDNDLVEFICSLIGIEGISGQNTRENINSSFDPYLVEIIRVMNQFALREGFCKSYLPKHLYINQACSGSAGQNRDKRIRDAMSCYVSQGYDFSQSFAFKNVYNLFFTKYSSCFVDGVCIKENITNIKYNASTIINSGYLLDYSVLSDLQSAWVDVRSKMSL